MIEIEQNLAVQLADVKQGDHVCLIYDNADEQMATTVPFIARGLELNECCVYIADDQTIEQARRRLEEAGIDVDEQMQRGALTLIQRHEPRQKAAAFDPTEEIDLLGKTVDTALHRGFSGLRVTGDMSWAHHCEEGRDQLKEYETKLNHFFPGSHALAICQYSRAQFSPSVLYDVLRTHPKAIVGNHVCSNVYYEPPEILQEKNLAHKVDWMIGQLLHTREVEAGIKRFSTELERRVKEKTASAEQAQAQFQTYCQTMAHDLRAPLRSMRGFAEVLMEDYAAVMDDRAKDYARRIRDAAERLGQMIEVLQRYSRLRHDHLRLEPVALGPLVAEVQHEILDGQTRPCEIALDGDLPAVVGHRASLKIVLANLLGNAVKFVPQDRVPRVRVSARTTADRVHVAIEDNGIGIAATHTRRIFAMFERLNPESEYPGHGMGLALVQQAIERMGGTIGVESAVGAGSRFWFELPLATSPQAEQWTSRVA